MGRLSCRRWPTSTSASIERERMANYIRGLEEERGKIEAFKRELPLFIEASREQLAESSCGTKTNGRGVGEESIPINKASRQTQEPICHESKKGGIPNSETSHWMITTQLFNPHPDNRKGGRPLCGEEPPEQPLPSNRQLFSDAKHRVGGAFHPFSKERQAIRPLPVENRTVEVGSSSGGACFKLASQVQDKEASTSNASSQAQRKSRRCWSPELHRRFVTALQQLGGSQVATPKQIRELMKVDGLTNDEVKSHLQKYRLHTRRPSPQTLQAPHLLVVGGIWVPPDYSPPPNAANFTPSPSHPVPIPIPAAYYSPLQLHHSRDQKETPLHSHSSSYGPLHFQSPGGGPRETDSGREQSVGDDRNSESSSWRADGCS